MTIPPFPVKHFVAFCRCGGFFAAWTTDTDLNAEDIGYSVMKAAQMGGRIDLVESVLPFPGCHCPRRKEKQENKDGALQPKANAV